MNTLTMNAAGITLPIFRFFDDLIPKVPSQGDTDIEEGIQKINNGDSEEGKTQIAKGEGEKIEEDSNN